MTKWDATITSVCGCEPRACTGCRAITRAVELATIEECARAAEAQYKAGDWSDGYAVASKCAAAIRALAKKEV